MSEPYIRLKNVDKVYETKDGPVVAVDDATFDIEDTQFISIVGPSGCGKTTILKMIAGLIPFTSGEITISGQVVDRPQTDLGIVFQDAVLLDWRNVLANVMLQIDIRGLSRSEYEPKAMDLLDSVGLKRLRAEESL